MLTEALSYVSPMHRAQRTLELLNLGCELPNPSHEKSSDPKHQRTVPTAKRHTTAPVTVTDKIREWDYGNYEGITSAEIRARRKEQGLEEKWDIWTDGCPGGESPQDVIDRIDSLIREIREQHHAPYMGKSKDDCKKDGGSTGDVVVVAHGHILRVFAMRWIGRPLSLTALIMEAGGVGTLSYEHKRIEEPAIVLGGGFVVGGEVEAEIEREENEGLVK